MAQYVFIKWTTYRSNDDLYDVKLLKDLGCFQNQEPNGMERKGMEKYG